jgi:transcription elongation factor Elf1
MSPKLKKLIAKLLDLDKCPHCGSWGTIKLKKQNGMRSFYCQSCGKTTPKEK